MNRANSLLVLAIILAMIAAAIHLVLGFFDLIPGENTVGPLFLGMGVGYLAGIVGLVFRRDLFGPLLVFYAVGLILAYAASRDMFPVEPIGLAAKTDEAALVVALLLIMKRPQRAPS